MIKFNRNYKLILELNDGGGAVIIEPPLTVQFNVNKSLLSDNCTMDISIYNLGIALRQRIFHDRFDVTNYRRCILEGGYGKNLSVLFVGNIYEANSARQGTNMITNVIASSGIFDVRATRSYQTIKSNSTQEDILKSLIADFPNLSKNNPVFGDLPTTKTTRATTVMDNTWNAIQILTAPALPSIQDEKVVVLQNDEALKGTLSVIDISTGLLETPKRNDSYLTITTLFEPNIAMGQYVKLVSTTEPAYNGNYKVMAIQHTGIISEATSGDCRTILGLLTDGKTFKYKIVNAQ